jgi:hypothetical protein
MDDVETQSGRRAEHYAAAIYGSIVAAALIEAFRGEHVHAEETALSVISTMTVFWVAHVWSGLMGERLHRRERRLGVHRTLEIAGAEWPLVEASFAPIVLLVLGWAGVFSDSTAEELALIVCIVQLFAWGLALGLRVYEHWSNALLSAFVNGMLGLLVVSLEVIALH